MLNSITNHSVVYAMQTATDTSPKVPAMLQKEDIRDVYQRADGSTATRFDTVEQPKIETAADADDKKFREVLH